MELEKQILVSGLDWEWSESVASYPASTYTLKYVLKNKTANPVTLTSTADGDSHKFEIDDSDTAGYVAGYYAYTAYVTEKADTDHIIPIATGVVEIKKDLATVSDARTHAMTMVDNLRTTIESLSLKTMDSVSIEGRSYTYADIETLEAMLYRYERRAGIRKRKRTLIQFSTS